MADKTLYDILEVSPGAPSEVVLAAYERLAKKYDPQNPENSGNPDIKILHHAIEEAYLTINNPEKRAQYDKKLEARSRAMYQPVLVVEPFWTTSKLIVIAIIVLAGGGYYYSQKKTEAKLAAETATAEAQAREGAEKARNATEEARLLLRQEQQERMTEERSRRERDQALRQFSNEQRTYGYNAESSATRERQQQQRSESQRQREEQQAAAAARNVAAKEKAELCRIERERYGQAISC
jgi:curved DNA-binding protein CbpA